MCQNQGLRGREGNRPETLFFLGNAMTTKILKVHILLSKTLVVIAQALRFSKKSPGAGSPKSEKSLGKGPPKGPMI